MLKITNITMRNFLSIGNTTQAVRLDEAPLTLVLGQSDLGPNRRNGVGKTAILQALCYGLYGDTFTNLKLDQLINNINEKGMLVTVDFERDGVAYRIERGRKPAVMKFTVQGSEAVAVNDAQGENAVTQLTINRLIGMGPGLFAHICAMNTYTEPFLKLKPPAQREVIEELLGIGVLSERAEAVGKMASETRVRIKEAEAEIKGSADANARIEQNIVRLEGDKAAWDASHHANVAQIEKRIAALAEIDFDAELAKFDLERAWADKAASLQAALSDAQRVKADAAAAHARVAVDLRAAMAARGAETPETARLKALLQEAMKSSDAGASSTIGRLAAEMERLSAETGTDYVDREHRLRQDAAAQIVRAEDAAALAQEKERELVDLTEQMANPDAHKCQTCGQGLDGTEHLALVLSRLETRAVGIAGQIDSALAKEQEHRANAARLSEQADATEAERQRYLDEIRVQIEAIRSEIVALERNVAEDDAERARTIRRLEDDLRAARAAHEQESDALIDGLVKTENEYAATMKAARAEVEAAQRAIDAHAEVRPDRPTYADRDAVWREKAAYDKLLVDYETTVAKANPYEAQIEALRATIAPVDFTKLNAERETLKHQEFLGKLLSDKGSFVRKRIVDRSLRRLNERTSFYAQALGLAHEVRFEPDLTVSIRLMDRELSYGQLSRGEANRVNTGAAWSFRDVWEELNVPLNLMMVDEQIDTGIDDEGADMAVSVLSKMAVERKRNVFLISHKQSFIGRVNRILKVHMENRFTRFEHDAEI